MARGGRTRTQIDGPERRCIVTRETRPKRDLLRFVVGPDGSLVPDMTGKLPGRGIWVTAERAVLEKAVAKGLFPRAAKASGHGAGRSGRPGRVTGCKTAR